MNGGSEGWLIGNGRKLGIKRVLACGEKDEGGWVVVNGCVSRLAVEIDKDNVVARENFPHNIYTYIYLVRSQLRWR